MKKITLSIVIALFGVAVHGQDLTRGTITGSWINNRIADYYNSKKEQACDINNFADDKLVPLWLSFENKSQLKVAFRIEQRIFTYKIKYYGPDSIFIYREGNIHRIHVINNVIQLQYNHNVITFKKVSDKYSSDIFGEYIKSLIFSSHKNYLISFFRGSNGFKNDIINKFTFKQKIKELFKCDQVDIVQLGSFKYQNSCLPEVALYYNEGSKLVSPQVLGVIIDKDSVKFIDNSGINLLTLKSN